MKHGIISSSPNIWRLNTDLIDVNIAYSAYNEQVITPISSSFKIIEPIQKTTQNKYYVPILQFNLPLNITQGSNTYNIFNTLIARILFKNNYK
jgi:hypothetical protein